MSKKFQVISKKKHLKEVSLHILSLQFGILEQLKKDLFSPIFLYGGCVCKLLFLFFYLF